jgi:hypothetical protein
MGRLTWRLPLAGLVLLSLLGTGCSGSLETDPRALLTSEVSGVWVSVAPVGGLGTLSLTLDRFEDSRTYDALLSSQTGPGLGASEGFGTLADRHLVLDFGTGRDDEYYYEAQVVESGGSITGIEGQFIFPDQAEALAVNFVYSGPVPVTP